MLVFAPSISADSFNLFRINPSRIHIYDISIIDYLDAEIEDASDKALVDFLLDQKREFGKTLLETALREGFREILSEQDLIIIAEPFGDKKLISKAIIWKASKLAHYQIAEFVAYQRKRSNKFGKERLITSNYFKGISALIHTLLLGELRSTLEERTLEKLFTETEFFSVAEEEVEEDEEVEDTEDAEDIDYIEVKDASLKKNEYKPRSKEAPHVELYNWLQNLSSHNKYAATRRFQPYLSKLDLRSLASQWFNLDITFSGEGGQQSSIDQRTMLTYVRELYSSVLRDAGYTLSEIHSLSQKWWPGHLNPPKEYIFIKNFSRYNISELKAPHEGLFKKK